MTCSRKIIDTIKVIARIEGIEANNAITLDPLSGLLQFGGPLIKDTEVTGNYKLKLGSGNGRLSEIQIRSSNGVYLETDNGTSYSTLSFTPNELLIYNHPSSRGLMGQHDYSANYNDGRVYVQKIYTDNNVAGRPATTAVTIPGAPQHQQVLSWDNSIGKWTMTAPGAAPTAGQPTQVIYNDAGHLVGHENFTFTPVTNFLSVPSISLGHALLGSPSRFITAQGSAPDITISIQPKGGGHISLTTYDGMILLGAGNSPRTVQSLYASGINAQVDIALEPKGTNGAVYIGRGEEVGAYRFVIARGFNPNVSLALYSKGAGDIILNPDPDAVGGGMVKIGIGSSFASGTKIRRIFANSDYLTTNLELGGDGFGFTLFVGTSLNAVSDRFLTAASYNPDCNLQIFGKGQGLVAVNGQVRSKKVSFEWNMDAGNAKDVPHNLPDHKKIISVEVVVRADTDDFYGPLDRMTSTQKPQGGVVYWDATYIHLTIITDDYFSTSLFNNGSGFVRGWCYISYEI